jgi:hypothetical protein
MDIPMHDAQEWKEVFLLLSGGLEQIKRHRAAHGSSLTEARDAAYYGNGALNRYFQITGFYETNVNALWHHRLSLYGPSCSDCGKPLRTPRAKMCAACGSPRVEGG